MEEKLQNSTRFYPPQSPQGETHHQMTFGLPGDDRKSVHMSIPQSTSDIQVTARGNWLDSAPWQKTKVELEDGVAGIKYHISTQITHSQSRRIQHDLLIVSHGTSERHEIASNRAPTVIRRLHFSPTGVSVFKKAFVDRLWEPMHFCTDFK
jgi:hypothetical protein